MMVRLQLGDKLGQLAALELGFGVIASSNILAVNEDLGNSLRSSHVLGKRRQQVVTTCAM